MSIAGGAVDDAGEGHDVEIDEDVIDNVQEVVEQLLTGLRDKDTIVRWSSAKGVGRITGRIPLDFADDVVETVLELFQDTEGDGAWHGGCLALAELAMKGLLLPARLGDVVPVVVKALVYDVRRGSNSVGSHVRDAACYVCWAFARAYSPAVMAPHVHGHEGLSAGMMLTALFDREVNCRRAASAAYQENVGRQGHENFPKGIDILTAADYFTLASRGNAYLHIAPFVGQFQHYRYALIDHLLHVKSRHWDVNIRLLSAKALQNLTALDPQYMVATALPLLLSQTLSPDLLIRHGAVVCVSELILGLAKVNGFIPHEVLSTIRNVVMKIEKARLYRGRGGEIMRGACCRLIECMAEANFDLPDRTLLRS
jgi:hypothetical protein